MKDRIQVSEDLLAYVDRGAIYLHSDLITIDGNDGTDFSGRLTVLRAEVDALIAALQKLKKEL